MSCSVCVRSGDPILRYELKVVFTNSYDVRIFEGTLAVGAINNSIQISQNI